MGFGFSETHGRDARATIEISVFA
jgi:hypothetical protein